MTALFMKIDSSSDGEINWDEFCTYMQLEYAEKEESYFRSKEVRKQYFIFYFIFFMYIPDGWKKNYIFINISNGQ